MKDLIQKVVAPSAVGAYRGRRPHIGLNISPVLAGRAISVALVAVLLWHFGGGTIYAQARPLAKQQEAARVAKIISSGASKDFDALLGELKDVVTQGSAKTKAAPEKGFAEIDRLTAIKGKLVAEHEKNQAYFDALDNLIKDKGLGDEMLNRHRQFVGEYEANYKALGLNLDGIELAHKEATGLLGKLTGRNQKVDWDVPINRTVSFIDQNTPKSTKRHFDPKNLPHRSLKADNPIQPKLTRAEWDKALSPDFADSTDSKGAASGRANSSNAQPGSLVDAKTAPSHATSLTITSASKVPLKPLATAPPTPADLAETIEVKFTPEIKALADSLDKNPVRIYNWVRNNIEFIPTWGSIQGAQLCMDNRAGNAFDTSSLLISLLRYSGIPARYQMGTIEVPIDKFKNWAGGFTNAEAAASLFASGGIPSVVRRLNQNGTVAGVRMEHSWVKAFIDYSPSGGALNKLGNTWLEIDPSFKQHSFTKGVDFEAAVPSDLQSQAIELASTTTIDRTTGSITNFDSAKLQSFITQNGDQRKAYLQAHLPTATVGEAFGSAPLSAQSLGILVAAVPNRVLARAREMSELPDVLRHKITITLNSEVRDPASVNILSYAASLPELAGKNVLLLYRPASQADQQLISQTQTSLPSSLSFLPELYVGKQLVATGASRRAGSQVVCQISFSSPTISLPATINTLSAGETAAIGFDLQGISPSQVKDLKDKAQTIRDGLQQANLQNFTSRDFAEALLSNGIVEWFAAVDANNKLTARTSGIVTLRYPSTGLFFLKRTVTSIFNAPVASSIDGFSMDIKRDVVVAGPKDGDAEKAAAVSYAQGVFGSANEADIPTRMFSTPDHPASGIATIQALKLANDSGVPIYRINESNAPQIIPQLQIDPSDLASIEDAINAGMEVAVSQAPVNFNGRDILGIAIRDPRSGSAVFLITGGANGSVILLRSLSFQLEFLFSFGANLSPGLAPLVALFYPLFVLIAAFSIGTTLLAIAGNGGNSPVFNLTPCALGFLVAGTIIGLVTSLPSIAAALTAYYISIGYAAAAAAAASSSLTLYFSTIFTFILGLVGTQVC